MAEIEFAHPVERELARVFDAHGIEWEYEPHTFVLERDRDGTVREALTPDFYLPELDVYVECTVMRQRLAGRKRRKVRRVRERSGVAVGILFRRDFARLAGRWGLEALGEAAATPQPEGVSTAPATGKDIQSMLEKPLDTSLEVAFRVDEPPSSNGTAVLAVHGEVDLHAAPELRDRLRRSIDDGAVDVVVDLSGASFVDSTALGILLGAMKRVRDEGGQMVVVASRPEVRRIFEITLLDQVFPLHETREDALASLGGMTAA